MIIPLSDLAIVLLHLVFNFVILLLRYENEAVIPMHHYVQHSVKSDAKMPTQFIMVLPLVILCNCDFTPVGVAPLQNRRVVRTFHPLFSYFYFLKQ